MNIQRNQTQLKFLMFSIAFYDLCFNSVYCLILAANTTKYNETPNDFYEVNNVYLMCNIYAFQASIILWYCDHIS